MNVFNTFLILTLLFAAQVIHAAEFEVLDRFSVDGYAVLRGSADIPGGSFTVGASTFIVKAGNVGIGTMAPASPLQVTGSGDPAINTAALTVGLAAHLPNTATRQYGIKVSQLGGRYAEQTGIYVDLPYTSGQFHGGTAYGIHANVIASAQAYQQATAIYGVMTNSNTNYGTGGAAIRGVADSASAAGGTVVANGQGVYGGHFTAYGKGNSVGVYADAYLSVSPISGAAAVPLIVASNGSELMRVTSGGNVGIGTPGPGYKLDVNGTLGVAGNALFVSATGDNFRFHANGDTFGGNSSDVIFSGDGVAGQGYYFWKAVADYNGTPVTAATLHSSGALGLLGNLTVSGTGDTTIAGKVGIGMTGPDQPLAFADTVTTKIQLNGNNANGYQLGLAGAVNGGDAMMKFTAGETGSGEFGFYTTTNPSLFINNAGKIGIGTASPGAKLDIMTGNISGAQGVNAATVLAINAPNGGYTEYRTSADNTSYIGSIFVDNNLGGYVVFRNWSDDQLHIGSYGTINFEIGSENTVGGKARVATIDSAGTYNKISDARLKTNIAPLPASRGLSAVTRLDPVTYNWRDAERGTRTQIGFIAQNVQALFPELVTRTSSTTTYTPDGTLTLNYDGFIPPLIKAVKELNIRTHGIDSSRLPAAAPAVLTISRAGKVGIGTADPTLGPLQMGSGAYVTAGGVWTDASSRAYKKDIRPLASGKALEALMALEPVTFEYKVSSGETHAGFIAEDAPALVAAKDRKGMSAMDIAAVLTKVAQEQAAKIEKLEARIRSLEERRP